jgi:RNA polymerase sigma factor (sigma-70 family)
MSENAVNDSQLSGSEPDSRDNPRAELATLITQHNDALVNYISRWVRSREDAHDIAQEAFVRIFRLRDPGVISHLRGFLYQTARNIATDWLRKRIVRETYVEEEPLRSMQEEQRTPEQICLAREELDAVRRAFVLLPPRTKLALLMVREDGLSYDEVGARLGIKPHSARRLVERALEFLLEAVTEQNRRSRSKP